MRRTVNIDVQRRNWLRGRFSPKPTAIRLPWLKSAASFYDGCTRCGECQKACPERIIVRGDGGFPEIDFKQGECTFCAKCAQACPEPLFELDSARRPWDYIASIDRGCLAYQGVSCQSCQDSCDAGVIKFVSQVGKPAQPQLNRELCTGCGACVAVCPVFAISVLPNQSPVAQEASSHVS